MPVSIPLFYTSVYFILKIDTLIKEWRIGVLSKSLKIFAILIVMEIHTYNFRDNILLGTKIPNM